MSDQLQRPSRRSSADISPVARNAELAGGSSITSLANDRLPRTVPERVRRRPFGGDDDHAGRDQTWTIPNRGPIPGTSGTGGTTTGRPPGRAADRAGN